MKPSTLACTLLVAISGANAYWKGFNVGANNPDGSCRTQKQWESAFKKLQSLPGHFPSARLYAASDCNTLANAVPAAKKVGQTLLVGLWTEDDAHFQAEHNALMSALSTHGHGWLIGVTVGNEDLYRNDTTAAALVSKVNTVRNDMRAIGVKKNVGHVDTWTEWVKPENVALIKAVDFVGTDGYPYFQDAAIEDGASVFWDSVEAVRNVVKAADSKAWVWITEVGWPVSGKAMGPSKASVANARSYYKKVACKAFKEAHTFWYAYEDYNESPSSGAIDAKGNNIYVHKC
ncbi:MAG: hypothetical protein M1828_000364 [Chrysothrix sp. TS-e1954]|nr:MAG: hypothetical protein M1828_000364 [Chrysothrix sp. TS-e1954]